jgi:histidine phosphotransferase ChpT
MMAALIEMRILELFASRLCHDLISPVSAVGNGLELLEDSAAGLDDDALELCIGSQKRASALLQAFRLAFGAGQSAESLADVRRLAGDLLQQGKVRLDWQSPPEAPLPSRDVARLLLNMIMLAQECLPRGGVVQVRCTPGVLEVSAEGQDPKSEEIRNALRGGPAVVGLTPRTVQAYITGLLVQTLGGELAVTPEAGRVRFRAAVATA